MKEDSQENNNNMNNLNITIYITRFNKRNQALCE